MTLAGLEGWAGGLPGQGQAQDRPVSGLPAWPCRSRTKWGYHPQSQATGLCPQELPKVDQESQEPQWLRFVKNDHVSSETGSENEDHIQDAHSGFLCHGSSTARFPGSARLCAQAKAEVPACPAKGH